MGRGNRKKKNKENLSNLLVLIGISLVVLCIAFAVNYRGVTLNKKDREYAQREEQLMKQLSTEEERAEKLEEERVYVQTKQYIEKVAKEKLGLVNKDEVLLKPAS